MIWRLVDRCSGLTRIKPRRALDIDMIGRRTLHTVFTRTEKESHMKRKLIAAAAAAAFFAAPAWAQSDGQGMMAGGTMMGPGMMGQGMMGGMMGQGTMGGGMMEQGMTGGYGQGMGSGMMGRYGGLDLSDEQRAKIAGIQREVGRKQWELMAKMHDQKFHMHDLYGAGKVDDASARKAFDEMSDAHRQMFETTLEARKRIDSVLTDEQRKQLR